MKTIIIGGVAAGMSAASKLKRLNKEMTIHVYEKGEDISYGGCGMPYYLSNVIPKESSLIARTKEQFENKGIQVFLNHEVTKVDPKNKKVIIVDHKSNKTLEDSYDDLVIATGTKANRTNIPGSEEVKPYVLNNLEDARKIKASLKDVKDVAIIGGGYIGLEIAENLRHLGINVHIIELAKQLLIVYDKAFGDKAKDILEDMGVQIHLDEQLESYKKEGKQTIIQTNKDQYRVDMVIESIGVRPNTEFLKETGIDMLKNGAIVTNKHMQTNIDHIYAGGDCVAYDHLITHQKAFVPLGTHANKSGRVIAENIAGIKTTFSGMIGSNIIKVGDYAIAKTGVGMQEVERFNLNFDYVEITAKNQSGYYPGAEPIHIRLVYEKDTKILKGAQMYGKKGVSDRINIMALAILQKMTADDFSQSDFAYAPPFSPVWDPLLVAANQIK